VRGCGVRSAGGPVELLELPVPEAPGPGEVVLEVQAAGMGRWDGLLHVAHGWEVGLRPPAALGVEAAGRVAAVAPDVTDVVVGDLVLAHAAPLPGGSGLWAEQALVRAAHLARRPATLDPVLAGGLPVAGLTARQALDLLAVSAGTRLLITGASGSTGTVALQLAVQEGATVTATAAARHADRLRALGAERIVDSHAADWAAHLQRGFDAVLVAVMGTAAAAMSVLRDGGRLCSITSDAPPGERNITSTDLYVRPDAAQLRLLAVDAAEGRLTLDTRAVRLQDAPPVAQQVTAGGSGTPKYVLTPA
jgi:NADPH:quinone reductase-like Zn-dependent oxidoreductase